MNRFKTIALCLLAVAAVSLASIASASAAAPEYGRCIKAEKNVEKRMDRQLLRLEMHQKSHGRRKSQKRQIRMVRRRLEEVPDLERRQRRP